ncbi:MAG: 2-C-methyl-D-erythritol 2,4-cyclodiphosphate synthase [Oscillospiraceae bacterium]|jgi:2-C-methyl-D-erythritol 2,4-cyclodiphosphate synthase|nr:2-C-methyl-D-erythritol 2,4-cyclodiphosphate synthase [Oscillospiraceae bacterium]
MRVGHGYDVHALTPQRQLILGGVKIDHSMGLLGHSDADVLVHAIMDSLLGAACMGDIGKLFPDNDNSFKGISSLVLLKKVCADIYRNNYKICNIDSTIIAQQPKLSEYIYKMRENISTICSIDIECISIKATTEEKLGFTGKLEGISAHSVCLIDKKYS